MRNRIYYTLKPFLPSRLRWTVRRWFARRKLKSVEGIWPILESAGQKPEGWPGWPDGKDFAFVITHDVEGQRGLDNVRKLAELEMNLGFRSSFNFVPEGDYDVPEELITWLNEYGFEVGVHDLHHNGKLYKSREHFRRSAERINGYLKRWGAVGYRSGFMLHNYDWHHDLDILYDATSFDTDPFEPQPDGVGTIFPFWVPAPPGTSSQLSNINSLVAAPQGESPTPNSNSSITNINPRSGYVELPYTLAQDSTIFFLLRQNDTKIWKQKLDWLAKHGGMALLNLHPDYVHFAVEKSSVTTFPAEHYAEFLSYVSRDPSSSYWPALPKDLAAWFSNSCSPAPTNAAQGLRLCDQTV